MKTFIDQEINEQPAVHGYYPSTANYRRDIREIFRLYRGVLTFRDFPGWKTPMLCYVMLCYT